LSSFSGVFIFKTDITFANASWGSRPQMAKIDEFEAQVRLLPLLAVDLKAEYGG